MESTKDYFGDLLRGADTWCSVYIGYVQIKNILGSKYELRLKESVIVLIDPCWRGDNLALHQSSSDGCGNGMSTSCNDMSAYMRTRKGRWLWWGGSPSATLLVTYQAMTCEFFTCQNQWNHFHTEIEKYLHIEVRIALVPLRHGSLV